MACSDARRSGTAFAALLLAWSVLPPAAADAELGGQRPTIAADQQHMRARASSVAMAHYGRHELTRPNGGMVREFTNADGAVFAVTWSGPGKPDLRALLGRYFAAYQSRNSVGAGRAMHSLRRPPAVDQPDLQIQTAGHMGWFRGIAFVPSLAPAGFAVADLLEQP